MLTSEFRACVTFLQVCNISNLYSMNKLCINKDKSNVLVIRSKWQLK